MADPADAVAALGDLGGPIALKLSSGDGAAQVRARRGRARPRRSPPPCATRSRESRRSPSDHGGEVLAERMAAPGVELLVAARTDAIVPALVIGLGGIWTELLDDVAIVPLPADAARIERALRSLRGAPVLEGGRGRVPCDVACRGAAGAACRRAAARPRAGADRTQPGAGVEFRRRRGRRGDPLAAAAGRGWRGRRGTGPGMHDVVVVGGGFAGVTAAREAALRGRSVVLLEARERLGGRTWRSDWGPGPVEYGGAWVHWHQPHTLSELTRAGLPVLLSDDAEVAAGTSAASAARRRSPSATRSRGAAGTGSSTACAPPCPSPTTRCSRSTSSPL